MNATCEGCSAVANVADLFTFDCACPRCGAMLVLDGEEPTFADEAPEGHGHDENATGLMPLPDFGDEGGDRPTQSADEDEAALFQDRPTKSDGPPGPAYDLPTKADTEDPYELAAQLLDSTVAPPSRSGATTRATASRLTTQTIPTYSEADLVESDDATSVAQRPLLEGTAPDAPPLPSWDDTRTSMNKARELEGLVEVLEMPAGAGTSGRGSRTYEREDVISRDAPASLPVPTLVPKAEQQPAASASTPRAAASPPGATSDAPRTGRHTRPLPGKLFGREDLDWLALIDDNLPESAGTDADGKPRVVIRLPENAAPTDDADSEQVRQFEQAIKNLEEGGPGAIDSLLSGTQAQALSDTRKAKRYDGSGTQPISGSRTQPLSGSHTVPVGQAGAPGEQDTRTRAEGQRSSDRETKPIARPSGPKTVDSFRHEDLDPALVCARDASSPDADRFRQLFQRIFHPSEGTPPRVIMVTSPRPGDGKTTVAANLAIAAAGRLPGKGAVLIDADPRGRGLLRSFGVRVRPEGLLEALRTPEGVKRDPRDFVLQFSLGALDVIPLGIPGSDAPELLASERMGQFIARVKEACTGAVVIIDASSVLHAADPLVLSRSVDGVLLVVRADRTARDEVRRTIDMLGPKRVLGLVLNDAAV